MTPRCAGGARGHTKGKMDPTLVFPFVLFVFKNGFSVSSGKQTLTGKATQE